MDWMLVSPEEQRMRLALALARNAKPAKSPPSPKSPKSPRGKLGLSRHERATLHAFAPMSPRIKGCGAEEKRIKDGLLREPTTTGRPQLFADSEDPEKDNINRVTPSLDKMRAASPLDEAAGPYDPSADPRRLEYHEVERRARSLEKQAFEMQAVLLREAAEEAYAALVVRAKARQKQIEKQRREAIGSLLPHAHTVTQMRRSVWTVVAL